MALHAVDDLSDAFTATRSFLFPFDWGRWLRLALISLFVAGGSGGGSPPNVFQYTGGAPGQMTPGYQTGIPDLGPILQQNLGVVVLLGGLVVLVSLALAWLSATFEFTLLESIRSDSVVIRRYVDEFSGLGTRLFAFRFVFGLVLLLLVGGLALAIIGPVIMGASRNFLFAFVILTPVFLVIGVVAGVIYVLTTAFVAPIMLLENRGVLSGWRRFWTTFKAEWTQFLVYLLVGLFVMIAVGIGVGIATAIIGVVLAIPFALVFFGLVTTGGGGVIGPLALLAVGIPLGLIFLVLMAFVQVPVQVYLRYWALLVLGDVDSDLDLIPEQRDRIRSGQEA